MSAHVSWISATPIKALAIELLTEVELLEQGLQGDRRFYLVDEANRLVNNKGTRGPLQLIHASFDEQESWLRLELPDGTVVEGEAVEAEELTTNFHRRPRAARRVAGPWDAVLSAAAGERVRLVSPRHGAPDRGRGGAASILGDGSLRAIAGALGVDEVDSRRFRMNFGVAGLEPHEEDDWVGKSVRIGDAVVIPQGNVGRCAITTQNPETGRADLDTLKALADYRGEVEATEPLSFGVHAAVAEAGRVRLGDAVALV